MNELTNSVTSVILIRAKQKEPWNTQIFVDICSHKGLNFFEKLHNMIYGKAIFFQTWIISVWNYFKTFWKFCFRIMLLDYKSNKKYILLKNCHTSSILLRWMVGQINSKMSRLTADFIAQTEGFLVKSRRFWLRS